MTTLSGQIFVRLPDGTVQDFALTGQLTVIGSSPAADISVTAPALAAEHARLHFQGDYVGIEDLGSEAGTLIDNVRLRPHNIYVLAVGSVIRFGTIEARWVPAGGAAPWPVTTPDEPEATPEQRDDDALLEAQDRESINRILTGLGEKQASAADRDSLDDAGDPAADPGDSDTSDIPDPVELVVLPAEGQGDFEIVLNSLNDRAIEVALATGSRFIDLTYTLEETTVWLPANAKRKVGLVVECTSTDWERRPFKVQAQVNGRVIAQDSAVLLAPPSRPVWPWIAGAAVLGLAAIVALVAILAATGVFDGAAPDLPPTEIVIIETATPGPTASPTDTAIATATDTAIPDPTEAGAVVEPPTSTPTPIPPTDTPTATATLQFANGVLTWKEGVPGAVTLFAQVPGNDAIALISDKYDVQVLDFTQANAGIFAVKVQDSPGTATLWLVRPNGDLLQTDMDPGWSDLRTAHWSPASDYLVVEALNDGGPVYYFYALAEGGRLHPSTLVPQTITPTFTATRTPTNTATATHTGTATRTATPSHTPTFTRTPTPTATLTFTPSVVAQPSNTATRTITPAAGGTTAPQLTPSATLPQAPEPTSTP